MSSSNSRHQSPFKAPSFGAASCHGASGEGSKEYQKPLIGSRSTEQLKRYIERTMPEDDPGTGEHGTGEHGTGEHGTGERGTGERGQGGSPGS